MSRYGGCALFTQFISALAKFLSTLSDEVQEASTPLIANHEDWPVGKCQRSGPGDEIGVEVLPAETSAHHPGEDFVDGQTMRVKKGPSNQIKASAEDEGEEDGISSGSPAFPQQGPSNNRKQE